jgi:thiamine biosynthesis lipoprotein
MACENEIRFYTDDESRANEIAQKAVTEVRRIEAKYSRYRDDSVTSQINRCAGRAAVALDTETASLVHHGESCYRISQHRFDLTSGVLRRAWNFKSGIFPSEQAVNDLLPLVGWDKVQWDGQNLFLSRVGMEIDFGGIGKEYAADSAARVLASCGVEHGLVNLGGDIRVLGPHPDGSPWVVYIAHPRQPGSVFMGINLHRGSLATSGDYQHFMEVNGRRYCHALNPLTGYPVSAWQSVSIVSPLCLDAGSISTIAMLLEEEALPFLKSRREIYLLVDASGQIHSNLGQVAA